jgi:hypothetical protein
MINIICIKKPKRENFYFVRAYMCVSILTSAPCSNLSTIYTVVLISCWNQIRLDSISLQPRQPVASFHETTRCNNTNNMWHLFAKQHCACRLCKSYWANFSQSSTRILCFPPDFLEALRCCFRNALTCWACWVVWFVVGVGGVVSAEWPQVCWCPGHSPTSIAQQISSTVFLVEILLALVPLVFTEYVCSNRDSVFLRCLTERFRHHPVSYRSSLGLPASCCY